MAHICLALVILRNGDSMTCPHDNISLPTTSDPDTVCADCGAILNPDQIPKSTVDTNRQSR